MNNPYAFPIVIPNHAAAEPGMTLLDYFAAKAMQSYLQATPLANPKDIAEWSYNMAEAMLKERESWIK